MNTTLIGDAGRFAIEHELGDAWPPYGRARLWLDGLWFGDIRRSMFLHHLGSSLKAMVSRDPSVVRCVYPGPCDVPTEDRSLSGVSWSWGDSFDDFLFVLYAVDSERAVHFRWALHESRTGDIPGYPPGPHHARVPYAVFDAVVTDFVHALAIPCAPSRATSTAWLTGWTVRGSPTAATRE